MPTIISSTTLRNNLASTIKSAAKEDYVLIQNRGRITSAMIDIELFDELLALGNPSYLNSVRQARAQYQSGKTITHAELFGDE